MRLVILLLRDGVMSKRPTNEELCKEYRELLSHGFYVETKDGEPILDGNWREELAGFTKAWRNDLWKKFRELEDRLCPHLEKQRNEC